MNKSTEHHYSGRILVVDNDMAMLLMMESFLRIDQFQVVSVPSAEDGLKQMKADEPFDFVISGFTLPGMNGLCFLQQVAELYQGSVRILMSGGLADSCNVSLARSKGYINRYVSKPFRMDNFRKDLQNDLAATRANLIAN
jgi:DNA-binding NtrC family response regulator